MVPKNRRSYQCFFSPNESWGKRNHNKLLNCKFSNVIGKREVTHSELPFLPEDIFPFSLKAF